MLSKSESKIKNIKESWKYLTELLHLVKDAVWVWVRLSYLESIAQDYINRKWLKWAFKWYMWFPANLCLSVNDCIVHWIPDEYQLKEWDVLKIDAWIVYNWWISDSAITVIVWWDNSNQLWKELYKTTKHALDTAMEKIAPWVPLFEYSKTIYSTMMSNDFSVIKNLTWHWVWDKVHEKPHIYNWPHPETKKIKFEKNMVLALEPITSILSEDIKTKPWNDWNLYTENEDLWAQWEYTVLVTDNWIQIISGIQ